MLLQFPTEGIEFRAERVEGLDGFRRLCRLPVIRQYGPESEDLGLYLASCEHCGHSTARLHSMPDIDGDLDFSAFEAELETRALDPEFGWIPPHCPECGELHPKPIAAIYGRYLPEIQQDLQVMLVRGGDRVIESKYWLMDSEGRAQDIERPSDCLNFIDVTGAPLSLRSLWRTFIASQAYSPAIAVYEIQPGYFIGLRPFAESEDDVDRMAQPFCQWLEQMQTEGRYDVIAYLRDLEDDEIPVPFAESYHAWLGGFASEIGRALIDPFLVVDSDHFVSALHRHAQHYGLSVRRDSGPDTLFVTITGGDIQVRLNVGPLLFRVIHEGLTFEQGIRRHFHQELKAVSVAAEVVSLLRAALPSHQVTVVKGHFLDVQDDHGDSVGFGDAIRVATAHDPRNEDEFKAMVQSLAPGVIPEAFTLGLPSSGHLAPVIPRKTA